MQNFKLNQSHSRVGRQANGLKSVLARALCATQELQLFSLAFLGSQKVTTVSAQLFQCFAPGQASVHQNMNTQPAAKPELRTQALSSPHSQPTYFGRPQDKAFFFFFLSFSLFLFFCICFQNPLGKKLFPTFYCLMRLESSRNTLSSSHFRETAPEARSTYTMLW